ncbi:MAG: enoyl-CoA hydratase/isomerase family protein [Verrucomicrobia bacterium]|nr:enoyl-CoA hydratase/isomerase family protein [Verrucomicrobiota bacterium]
MRWMPTVATQPIIRREVGDDKICMLTFDRPESGANIFDAATMTELGDHVGAIERDSSLRGLIIASAKKSIFIAGADLKALLKQAPSGDMRDFIGEGQRVFNRIAALKIPTVAAIHGACAGGGYEVTLACDWRLASDDPATRIGLPETTLGLVPAWGGSTRLPRLIGGDRASEVILNGKLHSATEALKLGLVDEVIPKEKLFEAAKRKLGEGKRAAANVSQSQPKTASPTDPKSARARALGIITTAAANPINESLRLELEAIVDLGKTESTQNLIRNFFLAEKYKKGNSSKQVDKVAHAAVIGAGVMGSGIAQWLSSRGVTVILRDVNRELLDRGLANIEKVYNDAVKRGLMTDEKVKQGRSRIVASTAPMELRDVRFIIEAASEKIEIKKEIFRELSMQAGPKTIVATNTSALSVSELAHCTVSPDRVIGLHFFNPVSRMKLVEIVVGKETSGTTKEEALAFVRQIGKIPVVVRDSPGFLVNRALFPYVLDAAELFEAGVDAEKIDGALTNWGMPMGPLRLIDEIGLDVSVDIAATLEKAYGERDRAPKILNKMREAKLLGRKGGAGFYTYEGKAQKPNESLAQWRRSVDSASGALAEEALANRLMFLMVNEAARCMEEKVVESPEDADYGMILGTGFPPHRGGPLRFAEHFGLRETVDEMNRLGQNEEKFVPCEILKKHARDGTKFYKS